jgi:prepilin-type processing-associated H-X9-DG protein
VTTRSRRGFTLFQLLLILALLALLFALFLPVLAKARADALREAKLNNLKQLMLACHNHVDANGFLPAGNDGNNFSAAAKLLPYLEEANLYNQLDLKQPIDVKANAEVAKQPVKVFLSPFDPLMSVREDRGATNYLFNAGTKPALEKNNGIFYQDSKTNLAAIPDGTSNTVGVGETLKGDGGLKAVDINRQHVELGKDGLKDIKEDAGVKEWKDGKKIVGDRCASWIDGRFLQGTFNSGRVPNDERPDVSCDGLGGWAGLRNPEGRVNVAFMDGSTRSISVKIDPKVWQNLIDPADGNVIPNID